MRNAIAGFLAQVDSETGYLDRPLARYGRAEATVRIIGRRLDAHDHPPALQAVVHGIAC